MWLLVLRAPSNNNYSGFPCRRNELKNHENHRFQEILLLSITIACRIAVPASDIYGQLQNLSDMELDCCNYTKLKRPCPHYQKLYHPQLHFSWTEVLTGLGICQYQWIPSLGISWNIQPCQDALHDLNWQLHVLRVCRILEKVAVERLKCWIQCGNFHTSDPKKNRASL